MDKVYFKTSGCSNNFAETEIMQGLVKDHFEIVDSPEECDVEVQNICTVKGDDGALSEIRKFKEKYPGKKLVITGCIPRAIIPKIREIDPTCSLLTTHNINEIVSALEEVLHDNPAEFLGHTKIEKVGMPRVRRNKVVGIIPISNSCLGSCHFCSVKGIKGKFYSFSEEKILSDVQKALNDGCKEIWLTSQDNGCYGFDRETNLAKLIQKICEIPGDFFIRVGMMNPDHLFGYLPDLIESYKHPKVFKFIHVPVQSGSNKVCNEMNRDHDADDFKKVVDAFRKEIPDITVATDIIVGYPTETDEDFQETNELIREYMIDVVNVAKFRKRKNTLAFKLKNLPNGVVSERSKKLSHTISWVGFQAKKKWRGWSGKIVIDEEGKDGTMIGRNEFYIPIISKGELGSFVDLHVKASTDHYLIAE